MRIIEQQPIEQIITCNKCHTKLAYEEDDICTSAFGKSVLCPVCREDVMISYYDKFMQFPDAFYHTNNAEAESDRYTVPSKDKITEQCVKGLKWCLDNDSADYVYEGGGLSIIMWRSDDTDDIKDSYYHIVVSTDFYTGEVNVTDVQDYFNK